MTAAQAVPDVRVGQMRNLGLVTLAFAMTFWAWNLIAPLGVRYTEQFGLSSGQKALLVATPVLVGSLGRIVTGSLADRFGGRLMFTLLFFASVPPALLVVFTGDQGPSCSCSSPLSSWASRARRSPSASRSSAPGSTRRGVALRRACSALAWGAQPYLPSSPHAFAWVALRAPADRVGSVAGIVGAAGGLGGFFPSLVMGATYDEASGSYTTGLVLLCITASSALAFVFLRLPRERPPE